MGDYSNQDTDDLLEEWQSIITRTKNSLAKASELASRMEFACMSPTNNLPLLQMGHDMHSTEAERDSHYELRRRTSSCGESSNSMPEQSESFKSAAESLRDRSLTKIARVSMISNQSEDMACQELETSLDLFRRRKTVHEIPQLVFHNSPEGSDKFKRRRSTGEVPRTPRMQLSCVNSPGTPSANLPRTPIPLAKNDPHTPDTHFHPPLFGGTNSCRKRDLSTNDNCPATPPIDGNTTPYFTSDDITSLFEKIKLDVPSRLIPTDDPKRWESDMNAAYYSAFKLIAAGMDEVQKDRKDFIEIRNDFKEIRKEPTPSTSTVKSKSLMTSVLEDVVTPLEILMNHEIEDDDYAEETLASIENALLTISKQVPPKRIPMGCTEIPDFFNRRVEQKIETMERFLNKATNKVTDEIGRAHFLATEQDFGEVASHVTELLRAYNEAICQLDFVSSGSASRRVSYET